MVRTTAELQESLLIGQENFNALKLILIAEPAGKARQRSSVAKEIW